MDFMRPSRLSMVDDILEDKAEEGTSTIPQGVEGFKGYVSPFAFREWSDVSCHHANLTNYFKDERDEGVRDWKIFTSAKGVTENNFLFFSPRLNNSIVRHPSFKRNLRSFTRCLNTLLEIANRAPGERDFGEFLFALGLLESIQAEHFLRGSGISELAGIVYTDLKKLYRLIIFNDRFTNLLRESLANSNWGDKSGQVTIQSSGQS